MSVAVPECGAGCCRLTGQACSLPATCWLQASPATATKRNNPARRYKNGLSFEAIIYLMMRLRLKINLEFYHFLLPVFGVDLGS